MWISPRFDVAQQGEQYSLLSIESDGVAQKLLGNQFDAGSFQWDPVQSHFAIEGGESKLIGLPFADATCNFVRRELPSPLLS